MLSSANRLLESLDDLVKKFYGARRKVQDDRSHDFNRLNATGFTPKWTIEDGLKETWDGYCHQAGKDAGS